MSRKTGRTKRLSLYDRGNTVCPICLTGFTRDQAFSGRTVTLEHVPIKALGGQARCLTCRYCNAQAGRGIDQVAAMGTGDRFGVTVDILGKRDTFMLSRDGKALKQPFAGFSKKDWRDLDNSESRSFTMSIRIPDQKAAAASSLKSAHLALFSLLGSPGGYSYIWGRRPNAHPANHYGATRGRHYRRLRYQGEGRRRSIQGHHAGERTRVLLDPEDRRPPCSPAAKGRQPDQPTLAGTAKVERRTTPVDGGYLVVLYHIRDARHRSGSLGWRLHRQVAGWP